MYGWDETYNHDFQMASLLNQLKGRKICLIKSQGLNTCTTNYKLSLVGWEAISIFEITKLVDLKHA
jgi:hypothetical protein